MRHMWRTASRVKRGKRTSMFWSGNFSQDHQHLHHHHHHQQPSSLSHPHEDKHSQAFLLLDLRVRYMAGCQAIYPNSSFEYQFSTFALGKQYSYDSSERYVYVCVYVCVPALALSTGPQYNM